MYLFSVIVPVYNGEETISRCIDSVLNQEFEDFELIIVDDGSTDKTSEICKAYGGSIKYIRKENGGVSSARNVGLKAATGKYILFIDSDDYVMPDYLRSMEKGDEDIVFARITIDVKGKDLRSETFETETYKCDVKTVILLYRRKWLDTVWGVRFKSDIIKDKKLAFDETMHICEDGIFMASYMLHVFSIKQQEKACYVYTSSYGNTLSSVSDKLFRYMLKANRVTGKIWKTRFKCLPNLPEWKVRFYDSYEIEVFRILALPAPFLKRYAMLKKLFLRSKILEYVKYKSDEGSDEKLVSQVRKNRPLYLLALYDASHVKKRLTVGCFRRIRGN